MVQRKVPNKLGVQADHVKSDKRLGNLKPTSCQHQDGKTRGTDMKKKMKRSRPIKLSDIESLDSSPLRKTTISHPGKTPPLHASTTAANPQKQQPVIKTTSGSPNYMKATSCSEARKERSQVSFLNSITGSDAKNLHRRSLSNSKLSSASSNKLMRTLTKSPSFKPVRIVAKKCSRVALCADINVKKATCSSTLKESKFPAYLMLNPGGTEAEGTSVLKVCPYNYCSLNGHHHTPLPSLKSFLKARRRSLKAQKSSKLETLLSPCNPKPSDDGTEQISSELLIFSDEKPPYEDAVSIDPVKIPMVKEEDMDFFIEIYAKTDDGTEAIEKQTEENEDKGIGFAGEPNELNRDTSFHVDDEAAAEHDNEQNSGSFFHYGDEVAAEQDYKMQVAKNLVDASALETECKENFEENNYVHPVEVWVTGDYLKEQKAEDAEAGCQPILAQQEAKTGCDDEGKCNGSMKEDGSVFKASDMEWEEGHFPNLEIDTEAHYLDKLDKESCTSVEYLSEIKKLDCPDEPRIIRSDDVVSNCSEEIVDEVLKELFEEETVSVDAQCNDADYEIEEMLDAREILETAKVNGYLTYDTLSSIRDAFEEPTTVGEKRKEAERNLTGAETASTLMRDPIVELAAENENIQKADVFETEGDSLEKNTQLGDVENDCNTNHTAEPLNGYQEDNSLQEVANTELATAIQISEDSRSSQELVNENSPAKHCDHQIEGQYKSINVVENLNLLEADQDGAKKFKSPSPMDSTEQNDSEVYKIGSAGNNTGEVEKMEVEVCTKSDTAETFLEVNSQINARSKNTFRRKGNNSGREISSTCNNRKWTIKCKKTLVDMEVEWKFNPKEPNFLPIVLDPEAEKVDLRHQIMDDRKNDEEWMLDYALRQAVTKLAPARKRKVALLVEAFEKVLPMPKCETHIRQTSAAFSHTRPIQACR